MKRFATIAISALFMMLVFADVPTAQAAWNAGDKVKVEWKGAWYNSVVVAVKDAKYKIHYDGWDAKWDEWVAADRMRARSDEPAYKVGAKIEVNWNGTWYKSTVLEVKGVKFKIHYDGWSDKWDAWVTVDVTRPIR